MYAELLKYYNEETWSEHSFTPAQLKMMLKNTSLKPYPITSSHKTLPEYFKESGNKIIMPEKASLEELDT